jgi:hypothetical protein
MNIIIKKSSAQDKKYTAVIDNKKSIHFGDNRYQDFTIHKDPLRKKSYLARHKHDKTSNPAYAGFYATNLLWNKTSLKQSIRDTNDKYNVNIKLKI